MPKVKFVANSNWQGRAFRPGQETEMDEATARAYASVDQVVILGEKAPPGEKTPTESTKKKTKKAAADEPEAETSEP